MITTCTIPAVNTKGPLVKEHQKLYDHEQTIFGTKYLTCGTVIGHILNDINISVCSGLDAKTGVLESGWANSNFISGMHYCQSTINQMQQKFHTDKNYLLRKRYDKLFKPKNALWIEFFMSLIFLYKKSDIEDLLKRGLAQYHQFAKDSPSFGELFELPDEFLGEYQILDVKNNPTPPYILIGKPSESRPKEERQISSILTKLQSKFPTSDIIYFENHKLAASKHKTFRTGTEVRSHNGLKILQYLNETI